MLAQIVSQEHGKAPWCKLQTLQFQGRKKKKRHWQKKREKPVTLIMREREKNRFFFRNKAVSYSNELVSSEPGAGVAACVTAVIRQFGSAHAIAAFPFPRLISQMPGQGLLFPAKYIFSPALSL